MTQPQRIAGWGLATLLTFMSIVFLDALRNPAWASCGGSIVHDAVGGYEPYNSRHGDLADVQVNAFGGEQYQTWRAVGIVYNSSYFAEAGWVRKELTDYAHPYKTWVNAGVSRTLIKYTVDLPGNTDHEFKAHDQNGDRWWSFAYDGSSMGNEYVNMAQGLPVSESERWCTSDSLWARFYNLKTLRCTGCTWVAYSSLFEYVDTPTQNDYDFCWTSATQYYVKQVC